MCLQLQCLEDIACAVAYAMRTVQAHIGSVGGIKAIVAGMHAHMGEEDVVYCACAALRNTAWNNNDNTVPNTIAFALLSLPQILSSPHRRLTE